ncbi:unnamed protein product [Linum tenue]|uniref:Aquaporin n=1 Tax=Linum tenue TaxID=586396 RepID=A0AAV0P2V2_9ROSI|nr:unnamed protein product [Linum tenue]
MIFVLVYCTAGISAATSTPPSPSASSSPGSFTLSLGAICGCGLVKAFQKSYYTRYGGGANELADGYNKGTGLSAEIIGTFVLVYTVFSATDPKRNARDSHVPVLAPLPIGFALFMVHLATIPVMVVPGGRS